jgi:hypothetical protein
MKDFEGRKVQRIRKYTFLEKRKSAYFSIGCGQPWN